MRRIRGWYDRGKLTVQRHCLYREEPSWNIRWIKLWADKRTVEFLPTAKILHHKSGQWKARMMMLMASNGVVTSINCHDELSIESTRMPLNWIMTFLTLMLYFYWLHEEPFAQKHFLWNSNIRDLCVCLKRLNVLNVSTTRG